jgi:C4-dicarboxylate transporter DctQ subunit
MPAAQKIRAIAVKCAEGAAAALLAAIFFTFLLQIFSRYVLKNPFGWTLELCLTLWVWLVFFGNAFVVGHRDHVAFDLVYRRAGVRARRLFALIGAAAIVAGMAAAFLPTWDFIDFLKIKKSATLGASMRAVFSVYALFMLAAAAAYAMRFFVILRRGLPADEKGGDGG